MLTPELKNVIFSNSDVIDVIRRYKITDMKSLSLKANVSWTTAKSMTDELKRNGVIITTDDSPTRFSIRDDCFYMLGIAIGASETKVSVLNANFRAVKREEDGVGFLSAVNNICKGTLKDDYVCFKTSKNYIDIYDCCTNIVKLLLDDNNSLLLSKLLSIGISIPGTVDTKSQEIVACSNIPSLVGIGVSKLINSDVMKKLLEHDVHCYFYHDTVAATVFEKENLYLCDKDLKLSNNIAVIYEGYGIGSGFIFNNKLYEGSSGAAGEISELYMRLNNRCDSNVDETDLHLEKSILRYVFHAENVDEFNEKTKSEDLLDLHKKTDEYLKYKQLLGGTIAQLINILNVELVILSGRILNGIPELKSDLEAVVNSCSLMFSSKHCMIINGYNGNNVVALGAAVLSYYSRINSSDRRFIIEWK